MRQKIALFLSFLVLLFGMQTSSFAADSIKVIINGIQIKFDAEPVIENGRTLVPLRAIFEALDATVTWDSSTKTVTGTKGEKTVTLIVGSTSATINGENKTLDVPASMRSGRTFIPLRFISESLGTEVKWDAPSKTITINEQTQQLKQLTVDFIDVGQADSILIQTPNGNSMLIDAGNNSDENTIISYIKSKGISKIDAVLATHPHEDHIGSMDSVIDQFDIGSIYMPKVSTNTKTFEDLLYAISKEGLKVNTAFAGGKINIDPNVDIEFLAPNSTTYEDLNNYSAVVKLTYKDVSYLFCGDAEAISENEMIEKGYDSKADIIKIGHHASKSSTSLAFLKKVSPKKAIISVGAGNTYGHPSQSTLDRLETAGVEIFRTDLSGTIISGTDGDTIIFNKSASPVKSQAPPTITPSSIVTPKPTPTIVSIPHYTATPTAHITNTPTDNHSSDITVYITKTGSKYHSSGCRYLSKSRIPISLEDAKSTGYSPCSVCNPPY